jgi:hypothetical protein
MTGLPAQRCISGRIFYREKTAEDRRKKVTSSVRKRIFTQLFEWPAVVLCFRELADVAAILAFPFSARVVLLSR